MRVKVPERVKVSEGEDEGVSQGREGRSVLDLREGW